MYIATLIYIYISLFGVCTYIYCTFTKLKRYIFVDYCHVYKALSFLIKYSLANIYYFVKYAVLL